MVDMHETLVDQISRMSDQQKVELKKYIDSKFILNNENLSEIERKVYNEYANVISDLIAKLEVHSHDLSPKIRGLIEMLFSIIVASYDQREECKNNVTLEDAFKFELYLENILYIMLIDLYFKRIKSYIKTFKMFNYRAIKLDDDVRVFDLINEKKKKANSLRKSGIKSLKKLHTLNKTPTLADLLVELSGNEIPDLHQSFEIAEDCLGICEKNYPAIIGNGYVAPYLNRVVSWLPIIISTLIAVYIGKILIMKWL